MSESSNLFFRARQALLLRDEDEKCAAVINLHAGWSAGRLDAGSIELDDVGQAGQPERTSQVFPRDLAKRGFHTEQGRAALIHAVTHIEFSAINLALDAVWRFRDMPRAFYDDWLQVAREETGHFRLLRGRLLELGHDYGDFPVHLGLWQAALQTAGDLLARMAIVPRVLEARGLDVTPGMIKGFRQAGDDKTAAALEIILHDEVGHVAAGSRWFHYLCEQRGLEPETRYFALLDDYMAGAVRCPLHKEARLQAGFSPRELEMLEQRCKDRGND